jgi:hypothetical protein
VDKSNECGPTMLLPTDFDEHNCGEKVDYLIRTIVPLIKERNDILQRAEVLLISISALYEKKLQDMESGQELEKV